MKNDVWQNIDNAPLDGSAILGVIGEKPHRELKIIYWKDKIAPPPYGYWIVTQENYHETDQIKCNPTHWQPLPLFPSEPEKELFSQSGNGYEPDWDINNCPRCGEDMHPRAKLCHICKQEIIDDNG
jgi:hypothetical protein